MMAEISRAILAMSSSLVVWITVKATVVLALGLAGAGLAAGSRVAVRHALLAAAFAALLLLPAISMLAPPLAIRVNVAAQKQDALNPPRTAYAPIAPLASRTSGAPSSGLPLSDALLLAWMAGAAIFLAPMAVGLLQARAVRRSALPWPQGQSLADRLAFEAGIGRRVEVLLDESLPGPMTCGARHPVIVLPVDAQNWDAEGLSRALVHELEHVRRGDWVSLCLARAISALYWFHPLVWMAWRRLGLEAERSCDDAVLARSEATAYADQLVAVAERLSKAARLPLPAMAHRADLATRVRAVLDSRQCRGRAGVMPVALACAAAAALVLTLSPLKLAAAPQSADQPQGQSRFLANTKLVVTTVAVTDSNGNALDGLQASDFVITEDGVVQAISVFEFQKASGVAPGVKDYYLLGYYPSRADADTTFRKIQVALKGYPDAKLDFRAGYYPNRPGAAPNIDGTIASTPTPPGYKPPVLIHKVEPQYSEEARKAKYQGTVLLNVQIDATGKVTGASVVRTLGLGLDQKAVEAVQKWLFKPATQDGQPIATQTQVEVRFQLM